MKKPVYSSVIISTGENSVNFMEVKSGNIACGILYRSSSPLKGGDDRKAKTTLAVKAGIKCIVNLDDNYSVINELSKDISWYHELVLQEKVICLPMTFTIPGIVSNEKKLKTALQFIISNEGPYLIHCFAGIDRTGFVSALLEALMGADIKDICKNYLSAFLFDNGDSFRVQKFNKMKYFLKQIKIMIHGQNITKVNIQEAAEYYLLNDISLSISEITQLKNVLGKTA